jgi:hypothetical protein
MVVGIRMTGVFGLDEGVRSGGPPEQVFFNWKFQYGGPPLLTPHCSPTGCHPEGVKSEPARIKRLKDPHDKQS